VHDKLAEQLGLIHSLEAELKALKQKVAGVENAQSIQKQDHEQLKNGVHQYMEKTD
jgi:hypothetical protein